MYPWTMFEFIAVATLVRTYALTISFLPSTAMETAFQPYFLIPFLFAVLLLIMEMGIVEHRPGLARWVLNVSPGLLLLAVPYTTADGPASLFLGTLTERCGSPLWMTTWGLVVLQGIGLLRGVAGSKWRLLASILPLIWIGPESENLQSLSAPNAWPLIVLGLVELIRAIRYQASKPAVIAAMCLSGALSVCLWDSPWFLYRRIVPYHLALVSVLIIGGIFRDRFARTLRIVGAILLPATAATSLIVADGLVFSHVVWASYLVSLTAAALLCWLWTHDKSFLYALLTMIIAGCGESIFLSIPWLRRTMGTRVLLPLALGIGSFVLATVISALKAGVGRNWLKRWDLPHESE